MYSYALEMSPDMEQFWLELDDGIPSGGTSTEVVVDAATIGPVEESGQVYFRIRSDG